MHVKVTFPTIHSNSYTGIPAYVCQDPELSLAARGLLAVICTHEDGTDLNTLIKGAHAYDAPLTALLDELLARDYIRTTVDG